MIILPKYQTFIKRAIAGFIDGLVFIPINLIGIFLIDTLGGDLVTSWAFVDTIIWTLYYVIGHGKYGQTLGKRAMGIKVLDCDEKSMIGYKRAFIRESVWFFVSILGLIYFSFIHKDYTLPDYPVPYDTTVDDFLSLTTLIWFILEIITMAFNSKRRALHDYMAGSVVIDIDEVKREEYRQSQQRLFEPVQ